MANLPIHKYFFGSLLILVSNSCVSQVVTRKYIDSAYLSIDTSLGKKRPFVYVVNGLPYDSLMVDSILSKCDFKQLIDLRFIPCNDGTNYFHCNNDVALIVFGHHVIKGIATDKTGTPIPYCSVSIKGTKIAAATNSCGEFELLMVPANFTIIFNCMASHDFTTFERRVKQNEITDAENVVFQLNKHGRIKNKECQKKVDNQLRKLIVK